MDVRGEVLLPTGEADRLVLQGELDIADQAVLRASFARFAHHPRLIVDLSAVTYMDSTVFGLLLEAWDARKDRPGSLVIRPSASANVRKLFMLTGFDRIFTFV